MLEDIEPRLDIRLQRGDVIVILGLPRDLIEFEKFSINGV
jgi:Trk K+ transport system NAD-binding subunit